MSPRASTRTPGAASLPWRGPGPDRPDLPLPPGRMPLVSEGALRKRWRYVGVYSDDLMLCAAKASVGPFRQSFWAVWDRAGERLWQNTQLRPVGSEVGMEADRITIRAGDLRASVQLGEGRPVEALCPSGRGWGWTEKRAGVPARVSVAAAGRSWDVDALAVDDRSAGYHQRHTSWHWSAGVGADGAGRPVAWNLVTGINDPPRDSERAIWLGGEPTEPDAVRFEGLEGIRFSSGARLAFSSEAERARDENLLLFRSRYRHRFGSFSGSLDGAGLAWGLGVMEEHEAVW